MTVPVVALSVVGGGGAPGGGGGGGLELKLLLVHQFQHFVGHVALGIISGGGFGADDDGVALFGAVGVDNALNGVIQQVDYVLLFHLHALLGRHVDSLKLFLGFGVLGVGFQALLDVVELGLHVALKAFKELNTGLAQLAVAHNTRHIHYCHLGLCVVVGLLAGKKHEAQQQSQRHNKTNSHGCNHSSQNMAGQWFGGLGVDEHVLCFYRHYNHFSRKLPHQRPIFRPLLIGGCGQRSEAY